MDRRLLKSVFYPTDRPRVPIGELPDAVGYYLGKGLPLRLYDKARNLGYQVRWCHVFSVTSLFVSL